MQPTTYDSGHDGQHIAENLLNKGHGLTMSCRENDGTPWPASMHPVSSYSKVGRADHSVKANIGMDR